MEKLFFPDMESPAFYETYSSSPEVDISETRFELINGREEKCVKALPLSNHRLRAVIVYHSPGSESGRHTC